MQVKIITDLTTEPVTLAEAKAHLVVDFDIDDALLTAKIKAARQWLEEYTSLAFGEKTIKTYFDSRDTEYCLPIGPVSAITSVTRTVQTVDTLLVLNTDYSVMGLTYLELDFTSVWTCAGLAKASYAVVYQAGFAEGELPEPIKEAICKLTAELYRDRENSIPSRFAMLLPHNVRALVSPYRRGILL